LLINKNKEIVEDALFYAAKMHPLCKTEQIPGDLKRIGISC